MKIWLKVTTGALLMALLAFGSPSVASAVPAPRTAAVISIAPADVAASPAASALAAAPAVKHAAAGPHSSCAGLGLMQSMTKYYVAAFMIGYCGSYAFFTWTPWGRSAVNWAVSVGCKWPWFVSAATGGRYSRC